MPAGYNFTIRVHGIAMTSHLLPTALFAPGYIDYSPTLEILVNLQALCIIPVWWMDLIEPNPIFLLGPQVTLKQAF